MNAINAILFAAALTIASIANGGDLPLCFNKLTKGEYILVVLRENGKAEFQDRKTHSDGTVWFLHEDTATWG